MKIGIPTDDGKTVGKVFGRAKNFALYDTEKKDLFILPNEGMNAEHGAGTGAASFLAEQGVTAVYAPEVGPKAAGALAAAGITVKAATAGMDLTKAASAS